jgi:hypothetical protein
MSTPKKRTAYNDLEAIEDAFVQSILDADGQSLREEFATAGLDPDHLISEIGSTIECAKGLCAKQRLETAKTELVAFRSRNRRLTSTEREAAHREFERARSGDKEFASKLMMAARKGEGLSDNDLNSVIDDFGELNRLENKGEEP